MKPVGAPVPGVGSQIQHNRFPYGNMVFKKGVPMYRDTFFISIHLQFRAHTNSVKDRLKPAFTSLIPSQTLSFSFYGDVVAWLPSGTGPSD